MRGDRQWRRARGPASDETAGTGYTCALAQWKIEEAADRTPHLLSEETYLNDDGTIAYDGQKYRIKAYWDGSQSIAEAYIV